MIEIFPNRLDGRPCETAKITRRTTVGKWLDGYLKTPRAIGEVLPISVVIEGEHILPDEWDSFVFRPRDAVQIYVEPKGADPFSITVALLAGAVAAFNALMPQLPGTPNSPGTGDSIASGSAKGNKVKLGDPIRESFGLQKIYPDYLLPPHDYFSDYRSKQMELGLCIGKGRFQINANNVRIGDTPVLSLGSEASYQIFEPGESVQGNTAFEWWHQAAEVGSSSTGAAGLELTPSNSITPSPNSFTFTFSGYTISIPAGSGNFPTDWTVGLVLRVEAPYTYTVTDGGGTARDVVSGPLGMLNPTVGQSIEVTGNNAGIYTVNSYTPSGPSMTLNYGNGAPANQMTPGTGLAAIGPEGLLFRITSISPNSITVDRLNSAGALDTSFPGFTGLTTNDARIRVDSRGVEGGWRGWFAACPDGEVTSDIELDFFFPNGLCWVGNTGNVVAFTAQATVQFRDTALGDAAPVTEVQIQFTNDTLDQGGYTRFVTLPYAMRPEFRLRKDLIRGESLEFHDTIQWTGLKSLLKAPITYAGVTCLGLRAQVSDRIAAQTESLIHVIATRILPVRENGTWQGLKPTRDLAPAALYVAQTLGAEFDLDELDRLSDGIWKDRGDHFDYAVTEESTAKEVLNNIFAAGFAELTSNRGLLRPVRDEPRSVFEHMYTPQNMTSVLKREINMPGPDDFDGVEVTYIDRDTWAETTVQCLLPGDTSYRKIEKVSAIGVTDRDKAYQYGMRRRRVQAYRRDSYSWATEMDALNSRYLSYCAVADDVPGYGQSALMLSYQNGVITASEAFEWTSDVQVVAVRRPDGSVDGPHIATQIDEFRLRIAGLNFEPDTTWAIEPPHLLFGTIQRWAYPVLVTEVNPDGYEAASVSGIGYDARVYLSDEELAP